MTGHPDRRILWVPLFLGLLASLALRAAYSTGFSARRGSPVREYKILHGTEAMKDRKGPPLALEVDDAEFSDTERHFPVLRLRLVNRSACIQEIHLSDEASRNWDFGNPNLILPLAMPDHYEHSLYRLKPGDFQEEAIQFQMGAHLQKGPQALTVRFYPLANESVCYRYTIPVNLK